MDSTFRVVSWNCRRAKADSGVWDYLLDLAPDVALLQEVSAIPETVRACFACHEQRAATNTRLQRFNTALLVRGQFGEVMAMSASVAWVKAELVRFAGNLVARQLLPDRSPSIMAISVYSPAFPVDRGRLNGVDLTGVRLAQNPDVWVADLLWASLQHQRLGSGKPWIVAGDFNLSETFDAWRGGPRGNREYLDRMATLGFIECLRHAQGRLTPTYRNLRGGAIVHQMDHLFATRVLAERLTACDVGSRARVFDLGLSDHLPIVADFCLPISSAA